MTKTRIILTSLICMGLMACGEATVDGTAADDTTEQTSETGTSDANTDPCEDTASTDDIADTGDTTAASESSVVFIATSLGDILIQVDTVNAPRTAANFLRYVDNGFYDGTDGNGKTTFHRVIKEFMIQGGGMTTDGSEKPTHSPIAIESDNGLSNTRGTLAMARTSEPNSATSQFYINHTDNTFLDYVDTRNPGYTVFGKVLEGMDTVDAIALVYTDSNDEPVEPVIIESMSRRAD